MQQHFLNDQHIMWYTKYLVLEYNDFQQYFMWSTPNVQVNSTHYFLAAFKGYVQISSASAHINSNFCLL